MLHSPSIVWIEWQTRRRRCVQNQRLIDYNNLLMSFLRQLRNGAMGIIQFIVLNDGCLWQPSLQSLQSKHLLSIVLTTIIIRHMILLALLFHHSDRHLGEKYPKWLINSDYSINPLPVFAGVKCRTGSSHSHLHFLMQVFNENDAPSNIYCQTLLLAFPFILPSDSSNYTI